VDEGKAGMEWSRWGGIDSSHLVSMICSFIIIIGQDQYYVKPLLLYVFSCQRGIYNFIIVAASSIVTLSVAGTIFDCLPLSWNHCCSRAGNGRAKFHLDRNWE